MGMRLNEDRLNYRRECLLRGIPQPPMTRCFLYELIQTPTVRPNYFGDIVNALQRVDSELMIYYDAATAGNVMNHGWHVYRRIGGTGNFTVLHHIFGVMEKMSEMDEETKEWNLIQWGQSAPCLPSMAVVEEYKRRAHRHANPHQYQTVEQMAAKVEKEAQIARMDAMRDGCTTSTLAEDWKKFRSTPGLATKVKAKQRFEENKSKKTQVRNVGTLSTTNNGSR